MVTNGSFEIDIDNGIVYIKSNDVTELDTIRTTRDLILENRKLDINYNWKNVIKKAIIAEGVTSVNCVLTDYPNLETVSFPSTLQNVAHYLFAHTKIGEINFHPDSNVNISDYVGVFFDADFGNKTQDDSERFIVINGPENLKNQLTQNWESLNLPPTLILNGKEYFKPHTPQQANSADATEAEVDLTEDFKIKCKFFNFNNKTGNIQILDEEISEAIVIEEFQKIGKDFHPYIRGITTTPNVSYVVGCIFPHCPNLKDVTFEKNVKSMQQFCFADNNMTLTISANDFDFKDAYEAFWCSKKATLRVPTSILPEAQKYSNWMSSTDGLTIVGYDPKETKIAGSEQGGQDL